MRLSWQLAQAHANRLRQTLDGERLGDVITSMANGSGNPVILWRQIDGSCELGLSAIAAMVDNEVLCHAFGDGSEPYPTCGGEGWISPVTPPPRPGPLLAILEPFCGAVRGIHRLRLHLYG